MVKKNTGNEFNGREKNTGNGFNDGEKNTLIEFTGGEKIFDNEGPFSILCNRLKQSVIYKVGLVFIVPIVLIIINRK